MSKKEKNDTLPSAFQNLLHIRDLWKLLFTSIQPCPPSLMTVRGRNCSGASWRDLAGASGSFGRENGSSLRPLEVAPSTEPALGRLNFLYPREVWGFPGGSECKESACSAGDLVSIPGGEGPLEEEIATHSSILAWRIPRTKEPGRLWSLGSQRAGHD